MAFYDERLVRVRRIEESAPATPVGNRTVAHAAD